MKQLYILWFLLLAGTIFISSKMMKIENELAKNTTPAFNYIEFEMPPDMEYSKSLFTSIRENGMTAKVQESMDVDFWYIFLYVGTAIVGWILLLKNFKIEKNWLFVLIAILGITAGICDSIENKNLVKLLGNWEMGAVENAAFFAKIKFAIILPLIGGLILGWVFFAIKKMRNKV